jgi:capsular polysaccharide biosynthesis protein
MDIRDLIRVVTTRWWLVIPLFVIVFGAAAVLTLSQTAMYRSTTTYLVQPSLSESTDLLGALGIVSRQSEIASTYAEIASSRRIHRAAGDASGLSPDEVSSVQLRTRLVPGTNVLEIIALAPDPEVARDFAAAVGEEAASYVSVLYGDVFELQVLDTPQLSRRPASPNVPLNLVLGAAVALVLAVGAAFALEILGGSRVIHGREGDIDPSGAASE